MFLIAPLLGGRIHYAWFVAGATFLLLLAARSALTEASAKP